MRRFVALTLLLTLMAGSAFGGAWTRARGASYLKLSYIGSTATRILGEPGGLRYDGNALFAYGEYGLTERLTVVLSSPALQRVVYRVESIRGTTKSLGSGDLESRLRVGILIDGPVIVSTALGTKWPVAYDVEHLPPLGTGKRDFDLRLLLGRSFWPRDGYLNLDVGHRWRGGPYLDEWQGMAELGVGVGGGLLLRAELDGIVSRGDSRTSDVFGFPLGQRRWRLGGGAILRLDHGIELDLSLLQTISGESVLRTTEWFFGVARIQG